MIITKAETPTLEVISSYYESLVHANYEIIRHVKLCWLAEEELEVNYPDHVINDEIYFDKKVDVIRFRLRQTRKIIAKVYFP